MTDLTDRMRTCAAAIVASKEGGDPWDTTRVATDAADLLIEASNVIEAAEPQPEPMEIIPPVVQQTAAASLTQDALWIAPGGPLPGLTQSGTVSFRPCPYCNSRGIKTVRRVENKLMLECPVCAEIWEFKR